jgi:hypothetical protein
VDVLTSIGEMRLAQQRYADAEPPLQEAVTLQEQNRIECWERYQVMSMLGASLAGQARFASAEPLMLAGYQGLVQRRETIPWANRSAPEEAGERVVRLYRDWGKPENAAQWQAKLQRPLE